jgi:hypothetical protein
VNQSYSPSLKMSNIGILLQGFEEEIAGYSEIRKKY